MPEDLHIPHRWGFPENILLSRDFFYRFYGHYIHVKIIKYMTRFQTEFGNKQINLNSKSQITNPKQIPNSNIQIPQTILCALLRLCGEPLQFSRHLLQSIHLLPFHLCVKKTSGWNLSSINGLNHTIDDKLEFLRTYVFPSKSANKGKQKRLILLITYSAGNL